MSSGSSTNAPSEASTEAIVQKLIQLDEKQDTGRKRKPARRVRIDPQPATSANGLLWMMHVPAGVHHPGLPLPVRPAGTRPVRRRDSRQFRQEPGQAA